MIELLNMVGAGGVTAALLLAVNAYFTEKGKGIATKQDIAKVTKLAESVKGELQYFNQLRYSIKTEERNAIVYCYEQYHLWLNLLTNVRFSSYHIDNADKLMDKSEEIEAAFMQVGLAEAKMRLYIGHDVFNDEFSSLKLLTLDLHIAALECVFGYFNTLKDFSIRDAGIQERAIKESNMSIGTEFYDEVYSSRIQARDDFEAKVFSRYTIIIERAIDWQIMCKEKLITLTSPVIN